MLSFRVMNEGFVPENIVNISINPIKHIVAYALDTGTVVICNNFLECSFTFPARSNGEEILSVIALAWRPDGQILAIAYKDGCVQLYNVDGDYVHTIRESQSAVSLNWAVSRDEPRDPLEIFEHEVCEKNFKILFNNSRPLSKFANKIPVHKNLKKLNERKDLNILAVGMEDGSVFLYSYGVTFIECININSIPEYQLHAKVVAVAMSKNFRILTVTYQKQEERNLCYYYRSFDLPLLSNKTEEIKLFSIKYGQVSSDVECLSAAIYTIRGLLQNIYNQINEKFLCYGIQKQNNTSITTDLIDMLYGTPSELLLNFFKCFHLTEADTFQNIIETSLFNILDLVSSHLQFYATSIHSNLNELKGMALWKVKFGALGIDASSIDTAIMAVGSFLLKIKEAEQVFLCDCSYLYVFFKSLNIMIHRVQEQPLPLISNFPLEALRLLREFALESLDISFVPESFRIESKLKNFDQYMNSEDIFYPVSATTNLWVQCLKENPAIMATGSVFLPCPNKSLFTLYNNLVTATHSSVLRIKMCSEIKILDGTCFPFPFLSNVTHFSCNERHCTYILFIDDSPHCSRFSLLCQSNALEMVTVSFTNLQNQAWTSKPTTNYKILDIKFFSKDFLMVLLLENEVPETNRSVLLQLPMEPLVAELVSVHVPSCNMHLLDGLQLMRQCRYIIMDNTKASYMTINSKKRIVGVYSASSKNVQFIKLEEWQ